MTDEKVTDETVPWTRFVALGDSFSEGLWDGSDDEGPLRGWADRLAAELSARRVAAGDEPLAYANLAIRGRKLRTIVTDQVDAALELRPDLVSLVGGGNDLLRLDGDPDRLAAMLEHAVRRLRAEGIDVLLATGFDTRNGRGTAFTRPKTAVFNANLWSIARREGAYVMDMWGVRSLRDWRMWAEDRIHLTPEGHARMAQSALVGLGLTPSTPDWDDPLAPLPPTPWADQLRADALWFRAHAVPWVSRRLHHTSTGDGRPPKYAAPVPLAVPGDPAGAPGSPAASDGRQPHDD